jgi:predicted lipoprotein
MRVFGVVIIIASTLLAFPASAAGNAETAQRFARDFIVPRFQSVAAAAHAQQVAWTTVCADRKRGGIEALKKAFNDVADAWSDVEFMRIGPAAVALRVERINWWLDRTDATGKALNQMLATTDPQMLTPEKLTAGSVAGQGLPVIERLLYPVGAAGSPTATSDAQRCLVGTAVATQQTVIADEIVRDWTASDGALAALMANARWKFAFADADEAASVMLTDLVAGLEGLKDLKVAMAFHDETNAKAPRLSEAWRSGRTLRDIGRNLAAIRQALAFFLPPATAAQKYEIDMALDDAERALQELENARNETARGAAVRVALGAFSALAQQAMAILPRATGLTLGFNNLDGD